MLHMFTACSLQNVVIGHNVPFLSPRSCKHGTHLTFPFAFLSAWLLPQFRTCLKCTRIQDGKQFNKVWRLRIFNTWHKTKIAQKLLNMLPLSTYEASFHSHHWRNGLWEAATIDMPTNIWNRTISRPCTTRTVILKFSCNIPKHSNIRKLMSVIYVINK